MWRKWINASFRYGMEATFVGDNLLIPELTQYLDLLFYGTSSCMKIRIQSFILHRVPTYAYSQAHFSTREYIYFRRLFGNKSRLALGENDHCCNKFQVGKSREITKENKWLVKQAFMSIAFPSWAVGWICTQNMIKGNQMTIAQFLCRLCIIANNQRI